MNEETFAELSAGHALGALSVDDARAFAEALAAHPEWAHHLAADTDTAAALAEGVAEVVPPLEARSRLLAQIARSSGSDAADAGVAVPDVVLDAPANDAPDTVVVDRRAAADADADAELPPSARPTGSPETEQLQQVQRRSWTRGLFALVASLAVLVGVGWGAGAITDMLNTPTAESVLAQIDGSDDAVERSALVEGGGEATLHWSSSVGQAVLVADGLPELATDQTFELWFVRGDAPISAGTFDAAGGAASALLEGTMQPGDVIAVTVEQAGGSESGAPTTDPLLAIETT